MLLTTKGRYAVMAMVDIAVHGKKTPVNLASVAKRQEIDLGYLEQIFLKLKKAGLVCAVRGPGGGYLLGKEVKLINVFEIMLAVEETVKMTRCDTSGHHGCLHSGAWCSTHHLWEKMGEQLQNFLLAVSLEDVCQKRISVKL